MRTIKTLITISLIFIAIISFSLGANAIEEDVYLSDATNIIGLYPNGKSIFMNNSVIPITDSQDDLVFTDSNGSFVPVEFAGYMGADTDEEAEQATITKGELTFVFKPNESTMTILDATDGSVHEVEYGIKTIFYNQKLYIPLRQLSVALEYSFYIDERDGLILLSSRELDSSEISSQAEVARVFLTGQTLSKPITNFRKLDPNSIVPTQKITSVKTGTVNADTLRMREAPGSTVIKTLVMDEKVYILGEKTYSGNKWYHVRTQGWCYGYVMASYITNVKNEPIDVNFGFDYYLIDRNEAIKFNFNGFNAGVKFTSSNTDIAAFNSGGMLVGIRPGMTTVTASYGNKKRSFVLTVCNTTLNTSVSDKTISDNGTSFIATCEGGMSADGRFYKYKDVAGYWTIGYGHLIKDGETFPDSISAEEAEELLQKDLNEGTYVKSVNEFAKREGLTLTQSQFDSLVSFAFNLGSGYFGKGMDMYYLKAAVLSARDGSKAYPADIYEGFSRYHYAGGKKYVGLYTRRMDEAEMFLVGDYKRESSKKWPVPNDGGTWH